MSRHFLTRPDASLISTSSNSTSSSVKLGGTVRGWAAFETPTFDYALKSIVNPTNKTCFKLTHKKRRTRRYLRFAIDINCLSNDEMTRCQWSTWWQNGVGCDNKTSQSFLGQQTNFIEKTAILSCKLK